MAKDFASNSDWLPEPPTALVSERWRRAVLIAGLTFLTLMGVNFVKRGGSGDWTHCYVVAARAMQAGDPVHVRRAAAYTYPPAMAFLAVPLANLSPRVSLFGWYLVNVAAMIVVFTCAWRMAGGPPLARLSSQWLLILGLVVVLAFRYWIAPLEKQQTDMVIAALMMLGCLCLLRGRDLQSGLWLGAAAAMKCTPLLFLPYLLWRGRWRGAALLLFVAVGLNLLPDLCFAQQNNRLYVIDWLRHDLFALGGKAPGFWRSDVILNQSVGGFFNRTVQLFLGGTAANIGHSNLAAWAVPVVRALTYGSALGLLCFTAWRFGRLGQCMPTVPRNTEGAVAWPQLRTSVECGAIMCLMLLLSPMSGKAHYVILVLPCLLLARRTIEQPSRGRWLLVGLLLLCGTLSSKGLVGKSLGDATLLIGLPTWFAMFSLAGLWQLLRRDCEATSPALSSSPAINDLFRQRLLEDDEVVAPVRVPADADDVVPLLNRQV